MRHFGKGHSFVPFNDKALGLSLRVCILIEFKRFFGKIGPFERPPLVVNRFSA